MSSQPAGADLWRLELTETSPQNPAAGPTPTHRPSRVAVADATHPRRRAFEQFVEARFAAAYGARLPGHYPMLMGLSAPDDTVLAVAGVRFPEGAPLFLEQYLDAPVEQMVAGAFERPVSRESVVEIGSLAAITPGASLELFGALACWLAAVCGRRYAVATVRPELTRLLSRAGFGMRSLGAAEPSRLGSAREAWGAYYDQRPQVFVGEIGVSGALPLLRRRLRTKAIEREVRRLRRAAR